MRIDFFHKLAVFVVALVLVMSAAACGANSIEGTYSNGQVVLDIRSGGKAQLTMLGEVEQCTWKEGDHKLTLTCKGDSVDLIRHDDGSLGGPLFVGNLAKSK